MSSGRVKQKPTRGLTLIELLVSAAIISLLSSIVVASLQTARIKALDGTVRAQARELRSILELERTETGSYTAIKNAGGWWQAGQSCSGASGPYAEKTHQICTALVKAATGACGDYCVFFRTVDNDGNGTPDNPQPTDKYSIMVYLPGESTIAGDWRYLCLGSSGRTSVVTGAASGNPWTGGGCWSNP